MIFESGYRGRAGFRGKAGLLTAFVSRKVKLLKIIKTDSVINITRANTEIFPEVDTKERDFLPIKHRYSSVRCVILKDKALCFKILRETSFEFGFLG